MKEGLLISARFQTSSLRSLRDVTLLRYAVPGMQEQKSVATASVVYTAVPERRDVFFLQRDQEEDAPGTHTRHLPPLMKSF